MALYTAMSPAVEVNGQTVRTVIEGMGIYKSGAVKMLAENGIEDPQPGSWYPQQSWLDAFRAIAERIGPKTLNRIGQKIPENADFPPHIADIESALASIDVAYHMNHRGGEIGHYRFRKTGERSAEIVCDNPYPDDFDQGIIQAMASRFRPQGSRPEVRLDSSRPTRAEGAATSVFVVAW